MFRRISASSSEEVAWGNLVQFHRPKMYGRTIEAYACRWDTEGLATADSMAVLIDTLYSFESRVPEDRENFVSTAWRIIRGVSDLEIK